MVVTFVKIKIQKFHSNLIDMINYVIYEIINKSIKHLHDVRHSAVVI